jgi:hypothetical protein
MLDAPVMLVPNTRNPRQGRIRGKGTHEFKERLFAFAFDNDIDVFV